MPSNEDIQARVSALTDHANNIGLNPDLLELKNSEGQIKSAGRLKDIIGNANVKVSNLQEQASIALNQVDSHASIATAEMTQAQSAFLRDAVELLQDENPGVDPVKLQKSQVAMGLFKEMNDRSIQAAQQVEVARLDMYSTAIKNATQDTLKARGFSDAEIQTFATASTKQLMAGQADLKTTMDMAGPIANSMNQNLQTCTTRISEFDPSVSKIHDAVAQSFNTAIKVAPDGDRVLKPKLEGNETGTFSLSKADRFVKEAAAANGVQLQPTMPLHQQLEARDVPHVGGSLKADKAASVMAGQQASVTFKVNSEQALDDSGATLAFAKRGFGAKTEEMKTVIGYSESDIMRGEFKDNELAGTAAPLFGTAAQVSQADDLKGTLQVIGGDLNTLQTRAVASSALNKALGMNCLAEERIGMDEDRRTVGISVAVSGEPILKRPDDPTKPEAFLDIDYSKHEIQKGLSDLEVQDYITGQIDRHAGNIFIDPNTNQVKGIDNDLAFPTVDREAMLADGSLSAKAVVGLPQFIHVDTAAKIEALSSQELRETLQNLPIPEGVPGLEPAAIEGAVQRLENLKAEIKNMRLEGRLVTEFTPETTYEAAKKAQEAKCNPEMTMGAQGNASVPRTSYIGTAIMMKERTLEINQSANAQTHRAMVKTAAALPVNEQFVAFKNGVETAKQDLLQNPHKITDMKLAGQVHQAQNKVKDLEQRLKAQDDDVVTMKSRVTALNVAVPSSLQQLRLEQAKEALSASIDERQDLQQQLGQAQRELNGHLNKAVEPLKPQIHRTTGLDVLQRHAAVENQKVTEAQLKLVQAQNTSGMGNHRLVAAAQAELGAATQKATQANLKLEQFDHATQNAQAPRNTVAESMGRARSNSVGTFERVGAVEEKPAAEDLGQDANNQGWGAKPSEAKQSTRAALGNHRQKNDPQPLQQQTKVRSNSIG